LAALFLFLLVQKLPFEPSTMSDIVGEALTPFLVAATIVLPWRLFQHWRRKFSPMPMLVALMVMGLWQYETYAVLKESIGQ
jgi:hypothetical protein